MGAGEPFQIAQRLSAIPTQKNDRQEPV